jgi:tetratricopeptide (TPR) repeat protein
MFLVLATRHFTKNQMPDFADVALEMLKESYETADDLTEAERYYYHGRYEMLANRYDSAIEALSTACSMRRADHEWRFYLARAYFLKKRYEEAKKEIDTALFYEPNDKAYLRQRDDIINAMTIY